MKRRVVVTGLGAVTPIGNTVPEFWQGIREGRVGIGEITRFDTESFKVKLAAEVKDFDAAERMNPKAAKRMERFSQYAVAAAREAFADADLHLEEEDPFRAGVIVGSGIGSLETVESEYAKILKGNVKRVAPLMVPKMISNMAAGNISIQLGLRGKCTNVVTACASGTHCIGDAFRAIQYDDADIMLAGGAESCICPTGVAGFQALTALTTETDPVRASIPFDKDRSGFVLGEGAGVVVLEELQHALARGARIYAELVGYDEDQDLAVLKAVDAEDLPTAEFGDSDQCRVGDTVYAIGNPLGVELRGTLTEGIISAINRDVQIEGRIMTLIQTTAALNNGNSGGPLINEYGQVIGVNTLKMSGSGNAEEATVEGLGFALPSSSFCFVVNDLIANGQFRGIPVLGITVMNSDDGRVVVYTVSDGYGAAEMGIRPDDVLLRADGQALGSIDDLMAVRRTHLVGDTITLTVLRDGQTFDVDVPLYASAD